MKVKVKPCLWLACLACWLVAGVLYLLDAVELYVFLAAPFFGALIAALTVVGIGLYMYLSGMVDERP